MIFITHIPKCINSKYNINTASFFKSYEYFKEFDFYYWGDVKEFHIKDITIIKALDIVSNNRKEKSIKKAVFENHIYQVSTNKRYNHKLIEIFTNHISDPNFTVRFISLELTNNTMSNIDYENIDMLLKFIQKIF